MLELGIPVGAGTDPRAWRATIRGFRSTGSQPQNRGWGSMYPDLNRLSREEALRLYTQGSSWFSSENRKKGQSTPAVGGLCCAHRRLLLRPEERIKSIESVLTIVGGKVVHATDEFAPHAPPPLPVLPEWSPVKVFGGYGAPLDVVKAARASVPIAQRRRMARVSSPRLRSRRAQLLSGIEAPAIVTPGSGRGCDCFAF